MKKWASRGIVFAPTKHNRPGKGRVKIGGSWYERVN
jgi:hypothetical protein